MSNRGWDGRIKMLVALKTMKPIPIRHRILDLQAKGIGPTKIAECVGCARSTVHRHLEEAREEGRTDVRPLPRVIGVDS